MTADDRAAIVAETVQRMKAAILNQIATGAMGPASLERIAREIVETS